MLYVLLELLNLQFLPITSSNVIYQLMVIRTIGFKWIEV